MSNPKVIGKWKIDARKSGLAAATEVGASAIRPAPRYIHIPSRAASHAKTVLVTPDAAKAAPSGTIAAAVTLAHAALRTGSVTASIFKPPAA